MNRRITSLIAVLVASGGFALAIFIPSASAEKGHNTYTQYCENGTNTTYSEYDQYCETTTTVVGTNGTETVVTSPVTTPVTTPSTSSTTSSTSTSTAVADLSSLPGVTVSKDGTVSVASVGADLKVGTILAPGVSVLANGNGFVTISDNGVIFSVPYGAQLVVAADGVANITEDAITSTFSPKRVANAVKASKAVEQDVILPKGRTSNKFSYTLPAGVSFGKSATWAKVGSYFKVFAVSSSKSLRVAEKAIPAVAEKITVSTNKGRTAVTVTTKKAMSYYAIEFSLKGLQYTKAAAKKVTQTVTFAVTSKKAGKTTKNVSAFSYTH